MARRSTRKPGGRPAPRPARPAPAPQPAAGDPDRVTTASVALFLAVVGLLASLVLVPLSLLLGAAAVVVALRALQRGDGSRTRALVAVVVGSLALLSGAAFLLSR